MAGENRNTITKMERILNAAVFIVLLAVSALALAGCGYSHPVYQQITQVEAMQIMEDEPDCVIVDVRRPDKFNDGHIPGAINIPNEEITDSMPPALPDKNQMILIYCRSGNRSKEAAQKLADMGYTNVYEFGGINTWEGEIVSE